MTIQTLEQQLSVSDIYRQIIPSEKGEPLEEQIFPWSVDGLKEKKNEPLPLRKTDPVTFSNIMSMMAVEAKHWNDYQAYAQMVDDKDLKELLIKLARAEHVHHMKLMSFIPPMHNPSEKVLSLETGLLSTYALCMENERNQAVADAMVHIFHDHLEHAHFAADMMKADGGPMEAVTGEADLSGGRPLEEQFMKPEDTMWQGKADGCYSKDSVDVQTLVNVDMAVGAEWMAWHGYHCAIMAEENKHRKLQYTAFQSIEDQHLAIASSMKDPTETLLERALVHEKVEMQTYQTLMEQEPNEQVREMFEHINQEDREHARLLGQFAK